MAEVTELQACTPQPLQADRFNATADLPFGLEVQHLRSAMNDFLEFLGFINYQLHANGIVRLETMLMPANFSSIVGEFMVTTIPKYCNALVKNRYHNGHPDLIPAGVFANNATQHSDIGIEIKASRYMSGWQGHNPEDIWLMVFVFECNRPKDSAPKPFQFVRVVGAKLTKSDWLLSGRSATSRRTITASVTKSGYEKMMTNWLYQRSST